MSARRTWQCINCGKKRRCILIEASRPGDGDLECWHDADVRVALCRACLTNGDFVVAATLMQTLAEGVE